MGKKFKSIRTEIIVYCFFSVILAMITDIVLGGLIYTVSSTLGKKQYDKVPVSPPPGRGVRFSRHGDDLGMSTGRLVRHLSRDTLVSFMLVTVIATICFFIIYFLLFIKRIVKDMTYISDRIIDIADGKSDEKIIIERQDEIGEIAIQVNRMSEKIDTLMRSERDVLQANKDMITCVAHDLRTPLTSVIGYLQLAADMEKFSEQERHKYAEIAMRKANRLQGLIEELFSYTKLMSGEITLHKSEIDIVKLVEQMVEEFYPQFCENNLEYELSQNVSSCIINADGELMARAVQNLISNAIKYGKDGKRVFVEVEKFEKEIQVRVTNFGLIIPKESLERIFERFYRVEDSRSMQTGGTGLGLNIARQIVVLHGGMIKVESDIDGTIFTIALPLEKAEKDKERLVNITE